MGAELELHAQGVGENSEVRHLKLLLYGRASCFDVHVIIASQVHIIDIEDKQREAAFPSGEVQVGIGSQLLESLAGQVGVDSCMLGPRSLLKPIHGLIKLAGMITGSQRLKAGGS